MKTALKSQQIQKFKVIRIDSEEYKTISYTRRDFYKIAFVLSGTGIMNFSGQDVEIDRPYLLFFNPLIPYSWKPTSAEHSGYNILFTEDFLLNHDQIGSLAHSPLFKIGAVPAFAVDDNKCAELVILFEKLMADFHSDYIYKEDLIRNYVQFIMHEALKIKSSDNYVQHQNAAERITGQFLELLEQQFPIDSPLVMLKLKSASDYANALNVHINHLNQSVKDVTGQTTTWHIQQKMVVEAKMLLIYTNWHVSEIATGLGFEYPTYFNNFFKKQTGQTPLSLRK